MTSKEDNRSDLTGNSTSRTLSQLCGAPMEVGRFLLIAIQITASLEELHKQNIICGNINPQSIWMDLQAGTVKFDPAGSVSRSTDWNQAGLTYVSPEQTGRMNRIVDYRTDIYSMGITFYELLTGTRPFIAADSLELVYSHLARIALPPAAAVQTIPLVLSEMIMKLMAKAPEDRYQTVSGFKADLEKCLDQWKRTEAIEPFELGQYDISDRLLIPQRLYGRENDIAELLAAFESVVENGETQFTFVAGYSGIGKTSLVRELHKPVVRERGIFISGKFDQYKRNIPYATIAEAFTGLVQQILTESQEQILAWKEQLLEALGNSGILIAEIIPQIELIIGKQPPVQVLPPVDAQRRFNMVFQQFLSVFTRREHPLLVFLDDLQWSDDASLRLLEHLATQPEIQYLFFIGAYRDNEVDAAHPLMITINDIRPKNPTLSLISLLPLSFADIRKLIADAFQCDENRVTQLAQLICEKTAGIPFFVIQFLLMLNNENLVEFHKDKRIWTWDIDRIRSQGHTDNVVDLMVSQLLKLSEETQKSLKFAACIGNRFELPTLIAITGHSEKNARETLREAVQKGLLINQAGEWFAFLHDRVQQAAYSLIPVEEQSAVHLRIGRLMVQQCSKDSLEEKVFDIVNQMNRGYELITDAEEKEQLARFNLLAGRKAKLSTAYVSAASYLAVGTALLPEEPWESDYQLCYDLHLNLAECTFMSGKLDEAENLLSLIIQKARTRTDIATASYIKVYLYHVKGQSNRAAETGIECLKVLDFELSINPSRAQVEAEYARVWQNLGGREIEELAELPAMTDPNMLIAMDILGVIFVPAIYTNIYLATLLLSHMVNISMTYGLSQISPLGFVAFALPLGPLFNDYQEGYRFGKMGYEMVERAEDHRFRGQVNFLFAQFINSWVNHLPTSVPILQRAFDLSVKSGDLPYACYCCQSIVTVQLASGNPLEEVFLESVSRLNFVREAKFKVSEIVLMTHQQLIQNLRGLTDNFSTFNTPDFNQAEFEAYLEANIGDLAIGVVRYYIRKMQARYFSGDYAESVQLMRKATPLLWTMPSFVEIPEYYYYGALALAAHYDQVGPEEQSEYLEILRDHQEQFRIWAENGPVNFICKYTLVSAEIARLTGDYSQAMPLYEEACRSARVNGFVQNEGISYECAGRFYQSQGHDLFASVCFTEARACFLRWGAHGKVKQMDQLHSYYRPSGFSAGDLNLGGQLDAIAVVKASQAISGEIVLSSLLEILMRTVLENAGAQKGCLMMLHDDTLAIKAEAAIAGEEIIVSQPDSPELKSFVPESVANFVRRTRESVILDDAREMNIFSNDSYLMENRPVSLLCLPVLRQANLIGLLYLENNLMKGAFTEDRIAVLELLAAQAAISLENSSYYLEHMYMEEELKELNQRLLDIIDFLPDATFVIDYNSRVIAWNKATEELTGVPKEDMIGKDDYAYSLAFYDDKRPVLADLVLDEDAAAEATYDFIKRSGDTISAEVFVSPVRQGRGAYLMAVASPLRDHHGNIVGVIESMRDITERKLSEEALRESEEYYRTIFENTGTATIIIEAETTISLANTEFSKLTGYTAEEIEGKMNWTDLVAPEDLERIMTYHYARRQDVHSLPAKYEFSIIDRWGELKNILFSVAMIPGTGKSVAGIVDITERRQAEEENKRLQSLLSNIIDSMPTVLVGVDANRTINQWNMEAERISGFSIQEVRGKEIEEVFPFMNQCSDNLNEALEEGMIPQEERLSLERDGIVCHLNITIYPLIGREIEGAVVLMDDITDKVRLDEIMIQTEKMMSVGGLAAGMAHEINNPLGGIIQGVQNIGRRFDPQHPRNVETAQSIGIDLDKMQEYMKQRQIDGFLDGIRDSGLRASKIVKNMLMFSRASQFEKSLNRPEVLLERSLELASSDYDLRRQYDFRHIQLIREYEPDLGEVLCSDIEIEQVLLNLMKNAAQAMQGMRDRNETPRIILRCYQESALAVIEVEDNGPGMDEAVKRRIFEPFYTTKATGEGTGLGLSVAYFIITQNHNGQMHVESSPSKGARFIIKLPLPGPGYGE